MMRLKSVDVWCWSGQECMQTVERMVDLQLVEFLIENHSRLVSEPILGSIEDVYSLYRGIFDCGTFGEFVEGVDGISRVSPGSIIFEESRVMSIEFPGVGRRIKLLDVYLLNLLRGKFVDDDDDAGEDVSGGEAVPEAEGGDLMGRLMAALDNGVAAGGPGDKRDELVWNHYLLNKLDGLLASELGSSILGKERAANTTEVVEFIPICTEPSHASLLSTILYIVNNKIVSIQLPKINKCESQCPGFKECLLEKIHYVPNLKPQTDVSLGDCSYLDTCHKLNSCRYVHYLQYIPETLKEKISEDAATQNKDITDSKRKISFYTHGECCSSTFKTLLPPQWIRCDVRKFDFTVLGKFSAVIADPAWNIHMNLPYGTCNDIELLELPLDQLQDEGVIFLWVTGRAIELGKESLMNWGYEVVNEIAWIKTNQLSRTIVTGRTGHWLNHSKEHLLVGMKGKPKWLNKNIDIDVIVSTTRETSRKPDELYGMVERMVGTHARKLEIFGRDHNVRPGWLTIGNQLSGNRIYEMDVKERYDDFVNTLKA